VSAIARGVAAKVQSTFIGPQLKLHLDFMESELGRDAWFAGPEFTAADVQMSFPLEAAATRAGLDASRPSLMAFLARIHARDAYRRALQHGGPYDFSRSP
jgi:glutathione S-transferase